MRSSRYLLYSLFVIFFISCKKKNVSVEYQKNPGWADQWHTMKQNEKGQIPKNLTQIWQRAYNKTAAKKQSKTGLINFKAIGPVNVGGRTHDILIDRANPSRAFAASSSGGLWITNNNGKKWKPLNDWASNLTITALTQNPFNHKEIYYATGVAAGGAGLPGEGVFKSTDGGETFNQLDTTATFGNIWDIEYSITDSNTMYVGTSGKGLYRTTDGAKSFERVINSGAVTDVEVFPNGSVLVAITNSGIFRSANGAAGSFTKITKGTPSGGFNRLELAKCDSFPNVVYANFTLNVDGVNGRNIGIWKSSTGGKTWYQVSEPLRSPSDIFAQPWFSLALGVDPLDSQKIVTGCRDMVFSKNGGKTWSQAKNGHADHMVYTFSHDRPGYFYCGNDGGIYEHNWETINRIVVNKNNDYNVTQYYAGTFTPDSTGNMAGSQDNGTNYSENGMESYKEDALGGDGAFCHIHQENPEAAYMSSQNGHIQKTQNLSMFNMTSSSVMMDMDANADGEIDDGAWFINPFEMNYKNSDMLFFPTRKRLWFSFDGASSWYPITNQIVNLYAVGIPNNQEPYRVYTGGDNLQLYRIDDLYLAEAGNEVSIRKNLPQGLNSGFISNITVHPRRDDIIYISLSNYSNKSRLWRIEDADTDNPKWIDIGSNLPTQLPVNWMVADPYRPDSFFVAGTDFGLYTTANAGKTWIKDERLPNVMVQNLRLRFSDRKLFIFTYGRGVYTANLTPMEDPFISINETQPAQLSTYPNPATDFINIKIEGDFYYEIYNPKGQTVLKGQNTNKIDISSLPKGNYSIKATTSKQILKSQIIVN